MMIFLIESAFGEGPHSGVVNLELFWGLWVTHIDELVSQGDIIFGIDIGGTYFGLSH